MVNGIGLLVLHASWELIISHTHIHTQNGNKLESIQMVSMCECGYNMYVKETVKRIKYTHIPYIGHLTTSW